MSTQSFVQQECEQKPDKSASNINPELIPCRLVAAHTVNHNITH
jgi:hypothetical protein